MTRIDHIARYHVTDSALYIACSGSSGWGDLARNLDPRCEQVFPGAWVAEADLDEARAVWQAVHTYAHGRTVHILGFSRGAAVAVALALWIPEGIGATLELYAPKRVGNRKALSALRPTTATAYRGDLIPLLPPWFRQVDIEWEGKLTWPWRAHSKSAKAFVRRRHEIGHER